MNRLLAAALAGAVVLAAGPALAGSADCLYRALPAEKSLQVDQAYDRDLQEGLDSAFYNADDLGAALQACAVRQDEAAIDAALRSLAGREFETQGRRWLLARPGVTDAKLQTAWEAVPPTVLEEARAAVRRGEGRISASFRPAREPFARALGLQTDSLTLGFVDTYLTGRVTRELLEPDF